MKWTSLLAVIAACCLSTGNLLAQSPPTESASLDFAGLTPSWPNLFGNPGVWGRINPGFPGCPTASFSSDVVVLQRNAPHPQAIILDGAQQPLLDASALGTSSQAGGRFNLTFFENNGWDFMFDGLFMGVFQSQKTVDTSNGVTLFFYNGVALAPVDTVSSRSDVDTGEFNLRRRLSPNFALLGGLRAMQLKEHLDFGQFSVPNSGYFSQSDNRLFGAQLGFEAVLPARGYGRFFAAAKYGIYDNRFKVSAQATSGGGLLNMVSIDNMNATIGDFNAGFEVQTLPRVTLRVGYQALWIQGVALSVDQLNQYNIFNGQGTVHKGNPLYQGGFVGLVFTM